MSIIKPRSRFHFMRKLSSVLLRYSAALLQCNSDKRRAAFYFDDDFGYIPQRVLSRHSAFLVSRKRYYQSIERSTFNKTGL